MEDNKKKKKKKSKEVTNIIRTTLRNNIDLTQLADNKANVLLSLGSLILTFLTPTILAYLDFIKAHSLVIPIVILALTCVITVYLCFMVLRPGGFHMYSTPINPGKFSPFFWGNYYNMSAEEFEDYIKIAVSNEDLVRSHLTRDLYYIGKRLGQKMILVKQAYNVFTFGLIISMTVTLALIFFF